MKIKKNKEPLTEKTNNKPGIAYRNLDADAEVAVYYGFSPSDFPEVTKEDREKAVASFSKDERQKLRSQMSFYSLEEKIAILRNYAEKKLDREPQPILFYYENIKATEGQKNQKEKVFELEIIGTSKSIAEAILIKTTIETLRQEGYTNLSLQVNSIGDRESSNRFTKELTNYHKRNMSNLTLQCRQAFKREPFEVLGCTHDKCKEIYEHAPKPISFLSEPCRRHFKEVLEYIESLDIPYRIKNSLVSNRAFCSQTVFEIRDENENADVPPLAVGVRYDVLSRKIGFKKELPAIGVRAIFRKKSKLNTDKKNHRVAKPTVCFIQLGFEAKLKSLITIEMLRQAGVPMHQALSRDKLTSQLALAENLKIPYSIIMGQKEAVENSVIVRNMFTRSQETIKIENLPSYLKTLK